MKVEAKLVIEKGSDESRDNPARIMLDALRRSGRKTDDIDLASFAEAAALYDQPSEREVDLEQCPAT